MSLRVELGLALILALPVPEILAQGFSFEGGLSAATGDYIYTQQVKSATAAVGLSYSGGRFCARATLPFYVRDLQLLTPASVSSEGITGDAGQPQYDSSWGDPMLQVNFSLTNRGRTAAAIGTMAKVPVLRAGDFGTGGWDFGGTLSLSRLVGSSTLIGLDVVGWRLADPPDLDLRDTIAGTVTVGRSLPGRWTLMASLTGLRSAVAGYPDPWWIGLLLGRSYSRGLGGLGVTVGLNESAPALSVALVWNLRLTGATSAAPNTLESSSAPVGP